MAFMDLFSKLNATLTDEQLSAFAGTLGSGTCGSPGLRAALGAAACGVLVADAPLLARPAALYAWRDAAARQLDESTGYLLPRTQLLKLAQALPRTAVGACGWQAPRVACLV